MNSETALSLEGELDRQMKLVRKGESSVIVCPWCGSINGPESPDCCPEYTEGRESLGRENLRLVIARQKSIQNGLADSIQCPYCDAINRPENFDDPTTWKRPSVNPWCCDQMMHTVMAIAMNIITQDQIDQKHRIEDGIAKTRAN